MTEPARVLVFTGDGKGKTTAALGMALRASGHGMRTLVIQFCKSDASTGEIAAIAELPGVGIMQTGLGFVPPEDDGRFGAHRAAAERGLQAAAQAIASGDYQLIILDEVCYAVCRRLLSEQAVIDTVRSADPGCCIVLTGRGATQKLIGIADTVTDMRCIKHGLQAGKEAQKGVEI